MEKSRYTETQIVKILKEVATAKLFKDAYCERGVKLAFFRPGRPTHNP